MSRVVLYHPRWSLSLQWLVPLDMRYFSVSYSTILLAYLAFAQRASLGGMWRWFGYHASLDAEVLIGSSNALRFGGQPAQLGSD